MGRNFSPLYAYVCNSYIKIDEIDDLSKYRLTLSLLKGFNISDCNPSFISSKVCP